MMITNNTIKQEMLASGFTDDGMGECPKCHDEVQWLRSPAGTKRIAINTDKHPERPGMMHVLGCGVKLE